MSELPIDSTSRVHARRTRLGLGLLVMALAFVLLVAGAFEPVENRLTSFRAGLLDRAPTGDLAIVEIDAKSLAEIDSWPWSRRYHAQVLRRLHASGATLVAFDIDFSAHSEPAGDRAFAQALREAQPTILPIFQQRVSAQAAEGEMLGSRPAAMFKTAWVGGVNILTEADGVVREYPAATMIDGQIRPSLAVLLAENDDVGSRLFQPDWSIDARRIPRFSFVDIVENRVPASAISGKRVLIGATAIELGDRYAIPRYGVVPGVDVQAIAAESLLQGRAMQRTSTAVTFGGMLLVVMLLAFMPLARPARYIAVVGAIVVAAIAGPIAVQQLWPVSIDAAAWLFTAFASAAVQGSFEARNRLRVRASFDAESGLPNREALEAALAQDGPNRILVTAAIERFESIRDGVGLSSANDVLRNAASLITEVLGDSVYRIAPDILAWMQPAADDHQVDELLNEIQGGFREPVETSAGPVDVTFTMGLDRDSGGSAAVLRIEHGLAAIGVARTLGKPYVWYRGADPIARRQLSMMSDLRHAMEAGRLRLAYQPKMSLATGRVTDAEALVRWHDVSGEVISPEEFIPLAEQTGVIHEVTIFALRTAARDIASWRRDGLAMRVAVNLSAIDLATNGFTETVESILAEAGVEPSQLALEVTESALIRSPAEAIATLTALRARGFRLSVDDYGTGQSTLSYLKHLPVHELKIDKSFVTPLSRSENDEIMVRSTINLAHELGLEVVAEGVEDRRTLDLLRQLSCDYAQGYLIGKAVPADELQAMASARKRRAA